jgi:hypothetical protein
VPLLILRHAAARFPLPDSVGSRSTGPEALCAPALLGPDRAPSAVAAAGSEIKGACRLGDRLPRGDYSMPWQDSSPPISGPWVVHGRAPGGGCRRAAD